MVLPWKVGFNLDLLLSVLIVFETGLDLLLDFEELLLVQY